MSPNVIIANEAADWGASRVRIEKAKTFFDGRGFEYRLAKTRGPGDARRLAAEAAGEGAETVIVIGGDGTINEAVNGVLGCDSDVRVRIGIVPAGSSNDFAKSLGIPQATEQACERIIGGEVRKVDAGSAGDEYFCMASTVGLLSVVAERSLGLRGLRGRRRYVRAGLGVIANMGPGWEMKIEADGKSFGGLYGALLISNTPRFGGLELMPGAKWDDGAFDCLLIEMPKKLEALHLVWLALRGGLMRHKKAVRFQAESVRVCLSPAGRVCNDGEICAEASGPVAYRIEPRRLRIIC
ncbi:MAG: YegS/Rv2252/BmrU family lipid kinase [Sedimentisphaerales bacterium]|nr:YegS/Rv2252/BmrU family lipid kinase [Sedimentisphaerales bacterium]